MFNQKALLLFFNLHTDTLAYSNNDVTPMIRQKTLQKIKSLHLMTLERKFPRLLSTSPRCDVIVMRTWPRSNRGNVVMEVFYKWGISTSRFVGAFVLKILIFVKFSVNNEFYRFIMKTLVIIFVYEYFTVLE